MNLQHFPVHESQMPTYSDPSASLGLKLLKNQRIVTTSHNSERFIQLLFHSYKKY